MCLDDNLKIIQRYREILAIRNPLIRYERLVQFNEALKNKTQKLFLAQRAHKMFVDEYKELSDISSRVNSIVKALTENRHE